MQDHGLQRSTVTSTVDVIIFLLFFFLSNGQHGDSLSLLFIGFNICELSVDNVTTAISYSSLVVFV